MAVFGMTVDGDAQLVNGQLVMVTNPAEEVAIVLRSKFKFVLGEYFLDTREGIPYFQSVFVKNPNLLTLKRMFGDIITKTENVTQILSLEMTLGKDRKAHFSFRALCSNGQVVSGGSDQAFIVEPQ